jgi:two-component system CheB/CheR fusion protein
MPEKKRLSRADLPSTDQKPRNNDFPIIGMAASAGGLEAFEQFFKQMPADICTALPLSAF